MRGKIRTRCGWARNSLAIAYHDREWGVPVKSDRKLFEFLILEGAQAGLSWDTILAKRENYRRAFDGFDPGKVEKYGARKKKQLMQNPVRQRVALFLDIRERETLEQQAPVPLRGSRANR